ncbi:hypothetical protein H4R19_002960, partial [Coemansia spiralis]
MSSAVSTPLPLEAMAISQPPLALLSSEAAPAEAGADSDSSDDITGSAAAAGSSRKRDYAEYASGNAALDPTGLSRRMYPAFGGKCYRHSAQVYLAECNSMQRRLQETLRVLPPDDQAKISGIWRAFASEPAERR